MLAAGSKMADLKGIASLRPASQSFNFLRPVYIGDEVLAVVEVISVDIASKRVTFKTVCTVRAKKVIDGIAEIFIP